MREWLVCFSSRLFNDILVYEFVFSSVFKVCSNIVFNFTLVCNNISWSFNILKMNIVSISVKNTIDYFSRLIKNIITTNINCIVDMLSEMF